MFKLDGLTGEVLWSQHYASPQGVNEAALGMALDSQDDVFITGRAQIGAQSEQALTMKLDGSDGHIVWMDTFGGSAADNDTSWDIVVDGDDQLLISGFVVETGGVANYFVRKMANADGSVIWDQRGPETQNNYSSRGTWLSLMDNDDVVMCQRVFGDNGYDVYLERFASTNGSTVWSRTYDGATHGGDDPKEMVADSEGNLLIAGVQDVAWNYNFMTLKINGLTGETLWLANYDGPPGWYDVAKAVAPGPGGSVVVSGLSDGSGSGWDWATVAYDGQTGAQLWVQRFNGPANQSDEPNDLICSAAGEVFVTGYAYGQGTNKDLLTVCYQVETSSAVNDLPGAAVLSDPWPNPFNPRVNFSFDLTNSAPVQLAIFDLQGRRVRTLVARTLGEGPHSASWDGRDRVGRAMPAGVYLAIMESGNTRNSRKVVLAK